MHLLYQQELRKKFKYLSHLPLSCDVTFLEVDLKGVVSDSTLDTFSSKYALTSSESATIVLLIANSFTDELRIRQKKRNERLRREDKSKRLADSREQHNKKSTWSSEHTSTVIRDDPFFNAPSTDEHMVSEEEAMLSEALLASTVEDHRPRETGPRTVWGTRAVESREPTEDPEVDYDEWGEEQVIVNKKGKKKLVLMSTSARRRL